MMAKKIRSVSPETEREIREAIAASRRTVHNDWADQPGGVPKSPDDYLVCLPEGGIPGRNGDTIHSALCAVLKETDNFDGTKTLEPILDGYDQPWLLPVWNIYEADVGAEPRERQCYYQTALLKSGTRYVVLWDVDPSPLPPSTTTTTAEIVPPVCTGYCKFVADAFLQWQLDADYCGLAATTTTTAATSTTPTTTTTSDCVCDAIEWPAEPTTTTTGGPTTTTTPEACECLYPSFCPTVEGQCTYTQCAQGLSNSPPVCTTTGTTTTGTGTTPTTTTPCDCGPIPPPPGCTQDCEWIWIGHWVAVRIDCPASLAACRCAPPPAGTVVSECGLVTTACVLPPPPPPVFEVCAGECGWKWVGPLGGYIEVASNCGGSVGCQCAPPSASPCASDECCDVVTPCVSPPPPTTTTQYSFCERWCYGTSTTAAPTTTTTAADCDTGGCVYIASGYTAWTGPFDDDCPDACPCETPPRLPLDTCEMYRSRCEISPPPTTTTAPPTTTTTAPPTTTTTAPPTTTTTGCGECEPAGNDCILRCLSGVWVVQCETCDPGSVCEGWLCVFECDEANEGNCCSSECGVPTTTTAGPTTTTTAPTTSTTVSPCDPCDCPPFGYCAYYWNGSTWSEVGSDCDAGETCGTPPLPPESPGCANVACEPPTTTTS